MRKPLILFLLFLALLIAGLLFWRNTEPGNGAEQPASHQPPPDTSTAETTASPTKTPNADINLDDQLQGLLIDDNESVISDGDILYQLAPLNSRQCEEGAELSFHLGDDTQFVRSNNRGEFTIPLPTAADQQAHCLLINASKSGYHSNLVNLDLTLDPGLIELELEPHRALTGQVLNPQGTEVAKASVKSWTAASGERSGESIPPCDTIDTATLNTHSTDAEGKFSLELAGNNYYCLQATHADWASSDPQQVEAGWDQDTPVTLDLQTGLTLSGQVQRVDGLGIDNLTLAVLPADQETNAVPRETTTNGSGEFVFDSLNASEYQLVSADPAYSIDRPKSINLTQGEAITGLEVYASPVTQIRGQLIDDQGRAVPNVTVQAYSPYAANLSRVSTQSDRDGYFVINSEHRSKNINDMMLMASGYTDEGEQIAQSTDFIPHVCIGFDHPQWQLDTIATSTDQPNLDLGRLQMQVATMAFQGHVKNHRGEPLAATLQFDYRGPRSSNAGPSSTECGGETLPIRSKSNERGEFSINLKKTGPYQVEVLTERYQPRRVEVELNNPGETIEIQLH